MLIKTAIASALLVTTMTLGKESLPPVPFTTKELKCLSDNIYYEARGETHEGRVLVARTVLNRVAHPKFPKDICSVVYQYKQFSWTQFKQKLPTKEGMEASVLAAYDALNHESEALYFHAAYVKPSWAKTKQLLAKEGNHIFYK